MRQPVKKAFFKARHFFVLLSLFVFVVIPSLLCGVYLWTIAEDQYASRVGFSVRHEDKSSALEFISGLSSLSGSSSSDTDILFEYLQSQRLVAEMDEAIDLRGMWTKPEQDFVFAFDSDGTIEDLVRYWNRMVRLSYGAGSGLLQVEAVAFDPDDALLITSTLLEKSSEMINNLSAIAREDSIRYAREELDEGVLRLKDARAAVTEFRNRNQLINPEMDMRSQAGLLGNLQAQQATTLIEIDMLAGTTTEDDPRVVRARQRLKVIENRIEAERKKFGFAGGKNDGKALADIVGEYERLVVDQEFAQRAYVTALAAYDGAQAEARRKNRYLAAYMAPTHAERAEYPERMTVLGLITMFLFLIWSVAVLVIYSIKDRR